MRDLTREQLEACASAPRWENVTPAMLFSAQADYSLSKRVYASNPQRYRELRLEWEYLSGKRARPDSFFQAE